MGDDRTFGEKIADAFDDFLGWLDWLDVIETVLRLALSPVSPNAPYSRWRWSLVRIPVVRRENHQEMRECAGDIMRHASRHGVICGCIGFSHKYSYWLVRKNQEKWFLWLAGVGPGQEDEIGKHHRRVPRRRWERRRWW